MRSTKNLILILLIFEQTIGNSYSQWYHETCDIVDEWVLSISMIDVSTGYISTSIGGGICRYDGNGHWDLISPQQFYTIDFVDSLNGWGIPPPKVSDNGGVYWNSLPDYPYCPLYVLVNAINTSTCYAIERCEDQIGIYHYQLIKTINGGNTWWNIYPSDNCHEVELAFFIDADHGWVGSCDAVFRTNNGGVSFDEFPLEYYAISDLFFTDTMNGWIVGSIYLTPNYGSRIVNTTDGGETWVSQMDINDTILDQIFFPDPQHGFAIGRHNYSDTALIYHTDDGGGNWYLQHYEEDAYFFDLFFTDSLTGWIVGGMPYPNTNPVILHTINGGEGTIGIKDNFEEIYEMTAFKMTPNPCIDYFEINLKNRMEERIDVSIYDLYGNEVLALQGIVFHPFDSPRRMNIESLSGGIYLVRVKGIDFSECQKLIVVR